MKTLLRASAALMTVLLLGVGCKSIPIGDWAPKFDVRRQAKDAEFGKRMRGNVDGKDAWAYSFRYKVPSKGSLMLNIKPSNPQQQLDIDVYKDGDKPIASTEKAPDKKLTVQDVEEGDYYVRVWEEWKKGEESAFELTTVYKPADPDEAGEAYKTQANARDLAFDKNTEDTVDYSARKRTHWWKVSLPGQGGLQVKFENKDKDKAKINAFLVNESMGAPIPIDPVVGFKKDDLPAGDYFVKVEANDAGDVGRYDLKATFKQGDVCKNGGDNCSFSGATELKMPADNKKGEVDYTKGKAYQFFKLTFKDKGKINVTFKLDGKGSKAVAYLMKKEDDEPEQFKGTVTKDVTEPGDLYIKVAANEPGEAGKFVVQTVFQTANAITVDIAEVATKDGCSLTVGPGAGTNQGVKDGYACTIQGSQGNMIDQCQVDRAYSNMAKVRPMGSCSKIPKNAKVIISMP